MKKLFSIFLLSFLSLGLFSQQTIIRGTLKNGKDDVVYLVKYKDLISYEDEIISQTTIEHDGSFVLLADPGKTIYALLLTGMVGADIYLEPGTQLRLEVTADSNAQPLAYSQETSLELNFLNDSPLNRNILDSDVLYNDFIMEHFDAIYKHRKHYLIDTLRKRLERSFEGFDNAYFENYIEYKIAGIEHFARKKSLETIAREHFIGKPVRYQNTEYMYLFHQLFDEYFISKSRQVDVVSFITAIKNKDGFDVFREMAWQDELLNKDERLLEMVLLNTLKELHNIPAIDRDQIILILNEAKTKLNHEENRKIASNLFAKFTRLKPGTPAPDFILPGLSTDSLSRQQLEGKITFINFWNLDCRSCIASLDSIANVYDHFKDDIRIVSISTDKDTFTASEFVKKKGYPWPFLHFNNQYEVLYNYRVFTFPHNILLDKQGNVLRYPAKLPAEHIKDVLRRYSNSAAGN